ncbi:hypothetical protein H0W26_04015 [Candidatus Dependentiae bacterium]|nr:hypothetical protein [Candidatus Dependentiae bacterium]
MRFSSSDGDAPDHDLINMPEKRVLDIWVSLHSDEGSVLVYPAKDLAERWARTDRTSCVHIVQEYVVGEGMP